MKRWYIVFLALIVIFAFFLRFYKLGQIPLGLNKDETAIGYNAYSIVLTGRDEYGTPFPLYFRSFDDYKLPVYIYLTALWIKLFGLTAFAVRFTSALFGTAGILGMYLLVGALSKKKDLALIAVFFLAVNPWNVFFSRAGFETNVAVSFLIFGAWLFVKAVDKPKGNFLLILSLLSFGLSMYTYNVTRLFAPLIFLLFVFLYRRHIRQIAKGLQIILAFLALGLLLPLVLTFKSHSGFGTQTSTLVIGEQFKAASTEFRSYLGPLSGTIGRLLFNNFFLMVWQYVKNVLGFFSFPFFFVNGANHPINGVENFGMFHIIEVVFIAVGLYKGIKDKVTFLYPFYGWMGIVIFVGSVIVETPHPTRHYAIVVPMIVFSAYGAWILWNERKQIKSLILRKSIMVVIFCLSLYSVLFFLASYFYRFPILYADMWRAQDKAVVHYVMSRESRYDEIVFDKEADFSYTSFLFYTAFPPEMYQKQAVYRQDGLLNTLAKIGKFEFRTVDWKNEYQSDKRILFISDSSHVIQGKGILKTFYYPARPVVNVVNGSVQAYPFESPGYVLVENHY